jgi:hypothetical protein
MRIKGKGCCDDMQQTAVYLFDAMRCLLLHYEATSNGALRRKLFTRRCVANGSRQAHLFVCASHGSKRKLLLQPATQLSRT